MKIKYKYLSQELYFSSGNRQFQFHTAHAFKPYEVTSVRVLVHSDHGHCKHCGSKVIGHALKCTSRIQ